MKNNPPLRLRRAPSIALIAGAVLAACGGGGGGSGEIAASAAVTLSGVAATGAPMAGAAVEVSDRKGDMVCRTTTGTDGKYDCTLDAGAQAPFAVSAKLEDQTLYSTSPAAESATVNITPLTTLIVSRLVPDGDPSTIGAAIHADPGVASETKVQARIDEVKTLLAPVLTAVGDTLDPIRGTFSADGTGHDRVLDALQISIRPEATSSNIEITVKTKPASDDDAPVKLTFNSADSAPASLAAEVRAEDLADDAIAGLAIGLMGRATACYAEPLDVRIEGVAAGSVLATGDATSVQAPPCRHLFLNDDPSAYLDNGLAVGSAGAFSGLFKDPATGTKFDRVQFEYQWANGDYYLTFRTTSRSGAVGWSALTVRKQGGILKAVGNQYAYDAGVRPVAVDREFPGQPQFSWFGSGYGPAIRNRVDPVTRLAVFTEVHVTAPDGRVSLYRPLAGNIYMGIVSSAGVQRTNVNQILGSSFQDAATPGQPLQKDGNGGATFIEPQLTDAELMALPDHGAWKIEWVHADAGKANVVQVYRTLTRAPTLGEIRKMKFVQLSAAFKAELMARSDVLTQQAFVFGAPSSLVPNTFLIGTAAGGDGWGLPEGAMAPTALAAYGRSATGASFSNSRSISGADRRGAISCTTLGAGDDHCGTDGGVVQFAEGSKVNFFELNTSTPRQMNVLKQIALYGLAP